MKNFVQFIKNYGRIIIEFVGVLGLIVAISQLYLQQKQYSNEQEQFTYVQSQKPQLEYFYEQNFSDVDKTEISQTAQQLTEKFFDNITTYSNEHPEKTFGEIAEELLPMITTVPAKPFSVILELKNKGEATATDVRVFIQTERPFSSIDVLYQEPYKINSENDNVVIEIDRIVAGDTVVINLVSTQANEALQDKLIIDFARSLPGISIRVEKGKLEEAMAAMSQDGLVVTFINTLDSTYGNFLPQIGYVPADQPSLIVKITSNEGSATFVPTIGQ